MPVSTTTAEPETSPVASPQAEPSAAQALQPEGSLEEGERTGDYAAWEAELPLETLEGNEHTGESAALEAQPTLEAPDALDDFADSSKEAEAQLGEDRAARMARQIELIEQGLVRIANSKTLIDRQKRYHEEVHDRVRYFTRLALWAQDLKLADIDTLWGTIADNLTASENEFRTALDQLLVVDTVAIPMQASNAIAGKDRANAIDTAIAVGTSLWESAREKYNIANEQYEIDLKFISDQKPLPHEVVADTVFGVATEAWEGGFAKNFELASMGALGLFIGFGKGFLDLLVTLRTLMEPEVVAALLTKLGDASALVVTIMDPRTPPDARDATIRKVFNALQETGLGFLEGIEDEWERIKSLDSAMQAEAIGEVFGRIIGDLAGGGLGKAGLKGAKKLIVKTSGNLLDAGRFAKQGLEELAERAGGGRLVPAGAGEGRFPMSFHSEKLPEAQAAVGKGSKSAVTEAAPEPAPSLKAKVDDLLRSGGGGAGEGALAGAGARAVSTSEKSVLESQKASVTKANIPELEVARKAVPSVPEPSALGYLRVSPDRRKHILEGDPPGTGHAPASRARGAFPPTWTDEQAIEAIERVANSPTSKWKRTTGANWKQAPIGVGRPANGDLTRTRGGDPVRYSVRGRDHSIDIEVIVEPDGEGIITGYKREP